VALDCRGLGEPRRVIGATNVRCNDGGDWIEEKFVKVRDLYETKKSKRLAN